MRRPERLISCAAAAPPIPPRILSSRSPATSLVRRCHRGAPSRAPPPERLCIHPVFCFSPPNDDPPPPRIHPAKAPKKTASQPGRWAARHRPPHSRRTPCAHNLAALALLRAVLRVDCGRVWKQEEGTLRPLAQKAKAKQHARSARGGAAPLTSLDLDGRPARRAGGAIPVQRLLRKRNQEKPGRIPIRGDSARSIAAHAERGLAASAPSTPSLAPC